jgi:hypothetical protein
MSIYEEVKANGGYISNHESDLYIEVNEANAEILKRHTTTATIFCNQVTGKLCYDVAFAYLPWWEARQSA